MGSLFTVQEFKVYDVTEILGEISSDSDDESELELEFGSV